MPEPRSLEPVRRAALRVVSLCTVAGCVLLLVEAFWISYGVFARYILADPDRMVTEGSALILLGLAFAGLPAALRDESFPKVTVLIDRVPARVRRLMRVIILLVMGFIGFFFAATSLSATVRTYGTGQTQYITGWPEFLVWMPVAFFTCVFTAFAAVRIIESLADLRRGASVEEKDAS